MNQLKRFLGLIWMVLGPIGIAILLWGAVTNINPTGTDDINKPLPWIIIIAIFTPIGHCHFALGRRYQHQPNRHR
ncbi:MAG: hypothetical protein EOO14_02760 [Chitinophagaceae bacterium]|nr:MAG: hypothetical protein EOO14_02760 [Chitinophagaceae bacterium]